LLIRAVGEVHATPKPLVKEHRALAEWLDVLRIEVGCEAAPGVSRPEKAIAQRGQLSVAEISPGTDNASDRSDLSDPGIHRLGGIRPLTTSIKERSARHSEHTRMLSEGQDCFSCQMEVGEIAEQCGLVHGIDALPAIGLTSYWEVGEEDGSPPLHPSQPVRRAPPLEGEWI
jgi:hypothetical protein